MHSTRWLPCCPRAPPPLASCDCLHRPAAVAERRLTDALHLLRRLDKLLARFLAGADRGNPKQQVGALERPACSGAAPHHEQLHACLPSFLPGLLGCVHAICWLSSAQHTQIRSFSWPTCGAGCSALLGAPNIRAHLPCGGCRHGWTAWAARWSSGGSGSSPSPSSKSCRRALGPRSLSACTSLPCLLAARRWLRKAKRCVAEPSPPAGRPACACPPFRLPAAHCRVGRHPCRRRPAEPCGRTEACSRAGPRSPCRWGGGGVAGCILLRASLPAFEAIAAWDPTFQSGLPFGLQSSFASSTAAAKLKRRQAALLRPASSGGGDADGSDYAAALGQKLALCLAAAADDVAAVFGPAGGEAELSAAFVVWALHQTERWVGMGRGGPQALVNGTNALELLLSPVMDTADWGSNNNALAARRVPGRTRDHLSGGLSSSAPENAHSLITAPPHHPSCLQGLPPAAQARAAALCCPCGAARLWPLRVCFCRALRRPGGQPRAAAGAHGAAGVVARPRAGEIEARGGGGGGGGQ